jgi:hypothetical protein
LAVLLIGKNRNKTQITIQMIGKVVDIPTFSFLYKIKSRKMKSVLPFFGLLMLLISCKNQPATNNDSEGNAIDTMAAKYTLTPFGNSPDFPDAALKAMAYTDGTFSTVISGSTYKLGEQTSDAPQKNCANSAEGQHLHLIVNTEPYVAKYESSFTHEIPDGEHHILCFLSRSYHESLKTPTAFKAVKAKVTNKTMSEMADVDGPMLFYSRPKGLYTGEDTKKVMLDYYLVNADQPGYKVEADINGEKHLLDKWQPYYIEGLPEGDNTIKLSLLDSTGQLVNAPLNPVSRTFKIEKTPVAN